MSDADNMKNSGRDKGWYKASNIMTDRWARILGPQPFLVYHVMKSLCVGDETRSRPQASQQDWSEWCGVEIRIFRRALKTLVDFGLIEELSAANPSHATMYEVKNPEEVALPDRDLLQNSFKVLPLSKDSRFHDPLFEPEAWQNNMFRPSETPKIRRSIRDALNGRSTKSATTRSTKSATTIVRQLLDRQLISKRRDKLNGSDEPCTSLNNSSSWDTYNMPIEEIKNNFVLISIPQKEQLSITTRVEQGSDGTGEVKTSPETSLTDRVRKNLPKSNGASRQTKPEQLPPREEMPQCLQTWFTLPLVTKPTVKTYHRIIRLIRQLEQGKFPSQYKSLNIDFVEQRKIKPEHLAKKWLDGELAKLLDVGLRDMIEDGACWPENKERYFKGLSFESFVLNKKTGRSWLLGLLLQPPQLLRKINTKQAIDRDPYPQCTYDIAEVLEISQKTNPEEYAGIARNFSKLVQFFQLLPVEEGHERDGIFKFVNHPQTLANSLVGFFEEHYSWAISKGAHAGLLGIKGTPIRKWLEEWNDQAITLLGRKKPSCVLELLDEYNQYGKIRIAVAESTEVAEEMRIPEEAEAPSKPTAAELRQREEETAKYLAPDDIIHTDGEKPEKGTMMSKLKAALARLKQGIPDLVVDEDYARF